MAEPRHSLRCLEFEEGASCFDQLSEQEADELQKYRVEVAFKKGETIFKQGTFASNILFIKKGLVKIVLESNHNDLILKLKGTGKLIGLPSLLGSNIYHYTTVAVTDTLVCMIDIHYFRKLSASNVLFANSLLQVLAENTVMNYDRLTCLTQKKLHGRLADILLCLSVKIYKSNDFEMDISRKELADLSGMSIESLARVLKDFQDESLINVDGRHLIIRNLDKIKEISTKG